MCRCSTPTNSEYTLVGTPRRAYRVRNGREASTGEINAECGMQNEGFKRAYYELLLSWTLIRTPYGREMSRGYGVAYGYNLNLDLFL